MSTKEHSIIKSTKSTKSSKSKVKEIKEKLLLRKDKEDIDMSSDDEDSIVSSISPELIDVFTNPTKKVPQGEICIITLIAISKEYEIDLESLYKAVNPTSTVEKFQKEIKLKKKKEKKKEEKIKKKIIPVDENGSPYKKQKACEIYRRICYENITEEEKTNEEYFNHNGNFDKNVYYRKKWKTISSKEKKKLENKSTKMKDIYNKAFEEQKPEEKPKGPSTNYILFGQYIRKKCKDDGTFDNKKATEMTKYIAQKWNESSQKVKDKYSKLALKSKEEHKEKMIEYEKRQIELIKATEKDTTNQQNSSNDEAGPAEASDNDEAEASDNDEAEAEAEASDNEDDSDSDSD